MYALKYSSVQADDYLVRCILTDNYILASYQKIGREMFLKFFIDEYFKVIKTEHEHNGIFLK